MENEQEELSLRDGPEDELDEEFGDEEEEYDMPEKFFDDDGKRFGIRDDGWGRPVRIKIERGVECTLAPRRPMKMTSVFDVEYENGKVAYCDMYPKDALCLGAVFCDLDDGSRGLLWNKQVVAAVARASARLDDFRGEEIELPTEEEADEIINELNVPYPMVTYQTLVATRPYVEKEWMKRWLRSGKLCYTSDLHSYEIESSVPENRRMHIAKSGREVAAEAWKSWIEVEEPPD